MESIRDYCDILKTLIEFAETNNYNIIVKLKGETSNIGLFEKHILKKDCNTYHKYPYLTMVTNTPLSDLLFSDIIVIQQGGTSVREALLVNPRTVQVQLRFVNDYIGIDKYDLLPKANSVKQLKNCLIKFDQKFQPYVDQWKLNGSEESIVTKFKEQATSFINDYYGDIEGNTVDQIYKYLREDIKSSSEVKHKK